MGAYYGKIKEEKNKKLLLTSRKLEDLLLLFITTSTETLKKRCQPGDEWKIKLEEQVFTFLRIVEDCLRNRDVRHVPPELFTKLEGLKAKMSSSVRPLSNVSTAATATPQGAVSSSLDTYPTAASMSPTTSSSASFTVSFDLADMPVARQLGTAFGIDEYSLQEDINAQKDLCTEKVCCPPQSCGLGPIAPCAVQADILIPPPTILPQTSLAVGRPHRPQDMHQPHLVQRPISRMQG